MYYRNNPNLHKMMWVIFGVKCAKYIPQAIILLLI